MFLYQIAERLAFLLQLLMWNESILVKGAASCLYSYSMLRVTLSVHCVGEQSDSVLLFKGLLRPFSSAPSYAAKLAYMLSPITADGHAAGGGLMLARPLVLQRRDNFSSSCQALLEPPLLMSSCCFAFLE